MSGKITKERLKSILEEGFLSVLLNVEGNEVEIEPRLFLNLNDGLKARGYTVKVNGAETKIADFNALTAMLSDLGAEGDGYNLNKIDGYYNTVEELDAKHDFDKISMKGLLELYADADEFEMVFPFFDDALTDEQAQIVYGDIADVMRNNSRERYEHIPEEQRETLPDFDTLYALITEECLRFREENARKIEERNGNAFFCDEFIRGNTKFTSPVQLWHIYNNVDFVQTCIFNNQRLKGKKPSHPLGYEIENNAVLKEALIFIKITYTWHCTTSSAPAKLFRFKLTDGAKVWLLTHTDDYDIDRDGFEDLALYKGEKLLFSSCTHEHFHSDCEK